jgi:hypothetical protein
VPEALPGALSYLLRQSGDNKRLRGAPPRLNRVNH